MEESDLAAENARMRQLIVEAEVIVRKMRARLLPASATLEEIVDVSRAAGEWQGKVDALRTMEEQK